MSKTERDQVIIAPSLNSLIEVGLALYRCDDPITDQLWDSLFASLESRGEHVQFLGGMIVEMTDEEREEFLEAMPSLRALFP